MFAIVAETYVRKLWIKYIIHIGVRFVIYLYIMDLINTRKMENISYKSYNFSSWK